MIFSDEVITPTYIELNICYEPTNLKMKSPYSY